MSGKRIGSLFLLVIGAAVLAFFIMPADRSKPAYPDFSYEVFETESGWGYKIYRADTVLLILQDVIPGVTGNKAFETREKAGKTARFVIDRLEKGIFPPTVSLNELDSLEVL